MDADASSLPALDKRPGKTWSASRVRTKLFTTLESPASEELPNAYQPISPSPQPNNGASDRSDVPSAGNNAHGLLGECDEIVRVPAGSSPVLGGGVSKPQQQLGVEGTFPSWASAYGGQPPQQPAVRAPSEGVAA
eukprot:CAMPEP_0172640880 /NCGR_PEP_ID=MMETSP1068-20121228/224857_1 /TAXON_ID=35684 /ORGANISM="Pseudopedinella elastica, Strain CCMP716" /LENGTH=134 /DNA_ID=CAMNT_0013454337 /DNA_START=64 /DNA_END=465 /DNA_ORIENTATION=-